MAYSIGGSRISQKGGGANPKRAPTCFFSPFFPKYACNCIQKLDWWGCVSLFSPHWIHQCTIMYLYSGRSTISHTGVANLLFGPHSPENCMKIKESVPGEAIASVYPPPPHTLIGSANKQYQTKSYSKEDKAFHWLTVKRVPWRHIILRQKSKFSNCRLRIPSLSEVHSLQKCRRITWKGANVSTLMYFWCIIIITPIAKKGIKIEHNFPSGLVHKSRTLQIYTKLILFI